MSKQSSIDFLIEQIEIILKLNNVQLNAGYTIHTILPIIEKLKAMHKEEIEDAHYDGSIITLLNPDGDMLKLSEQYYNETFEDDKEVL